MAVIENLYTYPIKSCAAVRHEHLTVTPRGLAGDRRYMLVDRARRFISGREQTQLVLVEARPRDGGLTLRAPGMDDLLISHPTAIQPPVPVRIWHDDTVARVVSPEADAWFSAYLGIECALVYQHEQDRRLARDAGGARLDDPVSFADGYPQLLIGSASLEDLNARLDTPVSMGRFRTNFVVTTTTPFVEDSWRRVRIGECEFDVVKRCARCVFTTVDPLSGHKDRAGEPLATLRRYRLDKTARGVMFGVNLIPRGLGDVSVGMPVTAIVT